MLETTSNSRTMLRLLRDVGPQSRAKLSERAQLSPTTVTHAMAPLVAAGWVEDVGVDPGSRIGRPGRILRISPHGIRICAVEIERGMVRLGVADAFANIVGSRQLPLESGLDASTVLAQVAAGVRELFTDTQGLALGVTVPGPVDRDLRTNLQSITLGWEDVPVAQMLEAELGAHVRVDSNVRTMALAEHRFGGHGVSDLAYLYVGQGVGLGIVVGDQPFTPGRHGTTAIGHIRVDPHGRACACGNSGCLETIVSYPAIRRRLTEAGIPVGTDAAATLRALDETVGTPAARIRDEVVDALGAAIGSVISNVLGPELILLGGILAHGSPRLLDEIYERAHESALPLIRANTKIIAASSSDIGLRGAAALALERFVYHD